MRPAYLLFTFLILSGLFSNAQSLSAEELMKQMFKTADKVTTLKYEMHKMERVEDKLKKSIVFSKFRRYPLSVYLKQIDPREGLEVLYPEHIGSDKAIINPNSFPWFNFKTDPNGSIMRNDQHHSIADSGFDHFMGIMKFLISKYQNEIKDLVSLKNDTVFDGKGCHVVVFNNPHFKYIEHKVKEGENLFEIAAKNKISEYMILEKNKIIDNYFDISMGQKITIPNDYAPKMVLYIDKNLNLPLVIEVYDDKDFYERYEYRKLEFNPIITDEEFTTEYKDYDF